MAGAREEDVPTQTFEEVEDGRGAEGEDAGESPKPEATVEADMTGLPNSGSSTVTY